MSNYTFILYDSCLAVVSLFFRLPGFLQFFGLRGLGRVDAYVEDVVAPDEDVSVVGDEASVIVLLRALQHDVHVSVRPRHPTPVLVPALQVDGDVATDALHEHVQRFLARLQTRHQVRWS